MERTKKMYVIRTGDKTEPNAFVTLVLRFMALGTIIVKLVMLRERSPHSLGNTICALQVGWKTSPHEKSCNKTKILPKMGLKPTQ